MLLVTTHVLTVDVGTPAVPATTYRCDLTLSNGTKHTIPVGTAPEFAAVAALMAAPGILFYDVASRALVKRNP